MQQRQRKPQREKQTDRDEKPDLCRLGSATSPRIIADLFQGIDAPGIEQTDRACRNAAKKERERVENRKIGRGTTLPKQFGDSLFDRVFDPVRRDVKSARDGRSPGGPVDLFKKRAEFRKTAALNSITAISAIIGAERKQRPAFRTIRGISACVYVNHSLCPNV